MPTGTKKEIEQLVKFLIKEKAWIGFIDILRKYVYENNNKKRQRVRV